MDILHPLWKRALGSPSGLCHYLFSVAHACSKAKTMSLTMMPKALPNDSCSYRIQAKQQLHNLNQQSAAHNVLCRGCDPTKEDCKMFWVTVWTRLLCSKKAAICMTLHSCRNATCSSVLVKTVIRIHKKGTNSGRPRRFC